MLLKIGHQVYMGWKKKNTVHCEFVEKLMYFSKNVPKKSNG